MVIEVEMSIRVFVGGIVGGRGGRIIHPDLKCECRQSKRPISGAAAEVKEQNCRSNEATINAEKKRKGEATVNENLMEEILIQIISLLVLELFWNH